LSLFDATTLAFIVAK